MKCPVSLIQSSLGTYTWPHIASLGGLVTDPIFAGRGAIAGTGTATYEARAAATPAVKLWHPGTTEERLPEVGLATLTGHMDDL
eukprot:8666641-Pyramimonas_sp.AAC.1